MPSLIYGAITSLDGYVADRDGNFDWGAPDEEVHRFINGIEQNIGTYLYGRRLYEVMLAWEAMDTSTEPPYVDDFARMWRAAENVVFSRTLDAPSSARTRIERDFDAQAVGELKESSATDVLIGGADLAGQAFREGLVDECQLIVVPVLVGGGKKCLPDNVTADLELIQPRTFGSGMVFLRYRVRH